MDCPCLFLFVTIYLTVFFEISLTLTMTILVTKLKNVGILPYTNDSLLSNICCGRALRP